MIRELHVQNVVKSTVLINRGYDIGAVDGLIGDKTRVAIRQNRQGSKFYAFRQEQAQK